jgi:CheY-like chemotaxis protein
MQKTILVADDSAMIRRIVGQIIQQLGHKALLAENGEKGLSLIRSAKPDLVIMDIEMPMMTGIEATARIKSDPETSHIPVLIFTSLGSEEDIRKAREAGCQGFLNKPISKEALQESINATLKINQEG